MTDDIIFEDPPHDRVIRSTNNPINLWLFSLREHPKRWAKWPRPVTLSMGSDVTHGRRSGIKPGEYEAVIANTEGTKGTLYARYLGEPDK